MSKKNTSRLNKKNPSLNKHLSGQNSVTNQSEGFEEEIDELEEQNKDNSYNNPEKVEDLAQNGNNKAKVRNRID